MNVLKATYLFFLTLGLACFATTEIERPRGVAISKASFYKPGVRFQCFDGSKLIDYIKINDDYCDCDDGSDEPGTAACPNGHFHCTNAGHKPLNIPSSRVNDGICDCCDGTDEYESDASCSNTCKEMGRAAREDAEKHKELSLAGYEKKQEYIEQGKQNKKEKQDRLTVLDQELEEAEVKKNEMQNLKDVAENPEKEAKDEFNRIWEEEKTQKEAVKEKDKCANAFSTLDKDSNGMVSVEDIQSHSEFDIDSSGDVSVEEAKEYLEDNDEVDPITFEEKVWPNIKEIYKPPIEQAAPTDAPPAQEEVAPPPIDDLDLDMPPHDEDDDPEDDDDYEDEDDSSMPKTDDDKMPEYTDDIKKLIEVADAARGQYNDAESKYNTINNEINDIRSYLALDLGPDEEFFPLKGQCYEYTDREYTYKLCPFDRASQRPKSGGSETSLGNWEQWDGPENNKYLAMKFTKGQNCWNGPDRSVRAVLSCGTENTLHGASEPNKCEYEFVFTSPAVCSQPSIEPPKDPLHEEL